MSQWMADGRWKMEELTLLLFLGLSTWPSGFRLLFSFRFWLPGQGDRMMGVTKTDWVKCHTPDQDQDDDDASRI